MLSPRTHLKSSRHNAIPGVRVYDTPAMSCSSEPNVIPGKLAFRMSVCGSKYKSLCTGL